MKKQILFSMSALVAATILIASCSGGYKAKELKLSSQEDSLNYALGLANGAQIKQYYLANDTNKNAVANFVKLIDKTYKEGLGKDELYQQGYSIGQWLKKQQKEGFMGNANYRVEVELVKQGFINGLKNFSEEKGMTASDAQDIMQKTMQKMQQEKMMQMQQQQVEPAPTDSAAHTGHQH
jgi:hypothetical protein